MKLNCIISPSTFLNSSFNSQHLPEQITSLGVFNDYTYHSSLIYVTNDIGSSEVPHQNALLGKGEIRLQGHDHDEREEAEDVKETTT